MKFAPNTTHYLYSSLFCIVVGIFFALAYGPHYGGVLPALFGGTCGLAGYFLDKLGKKKRA